MKKTVLLAAVSLVLFSCSKVAKNEFLISGTAKGIEDGKMVVLQRQDPATGIIIALDSVKIKGGKFELKGKATEPTFNVLQIAKPESKVGFILEEGEINVIVDKDSINKTTVKGTYNNDEFTSFKKDSEKTQKDVQKKVMDFQTKNMAVMNEAQTKKDTVTINRLMKEYTALQKEGMNYYTVYAEGHPKSFLTALIVEGMFNMPSPDLAKIKKIYDGLDSKLQATKIGKTIKTKLDGANKPAAPAMPAAPAAPTSKWINKSAPDFSAKTPDGKVFSLKQALGKLTLIDFWASWCGPCRKENPNLVALYSEYHSKGLNIIGVSLDGNLDKWKQAISKDKITWFQVSNLLEWNEPIAKRYEVDQIPTTFLLDSNGKIIATDIFGSELREKVKSILN